MAKKKAPKAETKSDFLRKVLGENPDLDNREVNRNWTKAGHPGTISDALFYQIRAKMGIKTERAWGPNLLLTVFDKIDLSGMGKMPPPASERAVYQLKITLKDVRPPVWRRLLIPDCPLDLCHEVIQIAMGWNNSHMYSFDVGNVSYVNPMAAEDVDADSAADANLADIIQGAKFKFRYTYDFGDDWRHEVVVEKVFPPDASRNHAECLDGKRACPPDDVGGPWGYVEFVEAIANPAHERHEELTEWSGGEFNPEAFDLAKVNEQLQEIEY